MATKKPSTSTGAKTSPKPAPAKVKPAAAKTPATKPSKVAKAPAKAPAKSSSPPMSANKPATATKAKPPAKAAKPAAKPAKDAAQPAPAKAAKAAKPAPAPALPAAPPKNKSRKVELKAGARVPRPAPRVKPRPAPVEAPPPVKMGKNPHTPVFVKRQRQLLLDLRDECLRAMGGLAKENLRGDGNSDTASAFGMHQADAGSDAYDRDFALSLLSQEQDALYEIEEALKRVDAGLYGMCEMSGKPIPKERLEAIPFARFTVENQEMVERNRKLSGSTLRSSRPVFVGMEDTEETPETPVEED
jgi:RNA polymerase-binding transcription factor DksA